jgi:beta-galactosidase
MVRRSYFGRITSAARIVYSRNAGRSRLPASSTPRSWAEIMLAPLRFTSYACAFLLLLLSPGASQAQTTTLVHVDASQPYSAPAAVVYDGGTAVSPDGSTLALNTRFLTLNGKPWLPVMGEFHYSRYPESQWEEQILKMKASGVQVISTYVIWIHQEEIEGQFDWSGQRDLRTFSQLCAKHGMYLVVRIGPWSHGELRNGGFPDWLLTKGPTRRNDPVFLSYVQKYFAQIGQQLSGMYWKDGGPIIGIQLSNEYSMRGPGAGEAYILELKKLARQNGMDVPLYLETAWDNAAVPPGAVLPVFGGYPAAPWGGSTTKLPPHEVYVFRFASRATGNMGAVGQKNLANAESPDGNYPYLTAEIGGGMQDTYHRRPIILPDDIASLCTVELGSGVNLYGTYMFQGGENPEGKLTTLQESQISGSATDVPVKSYDFQAPLGEFGQERESLRKLKLFQYFMNDFGEVLAPMTVHAPSILPRNPADFSVPRVSVRSANDAGFVFFNNYVRGYSMPARKSLQIQVKLPGQTLTLPRHPVDIPSGAYFIWPFNLNMDTAVLHYSTAQLFTHLQANGISTYVFFAVPGIPAEFALDTSTATVVKATGAHIENQKGITYLTGFPPATTSIELKTTQGHAVRLLLFTRQQAEDAWKATFDGAPHLLLTANDFYADKDNIYLQSRGEPRFTFSVTPPLQQPPHGTSPIRATGSSANASEFDALLPAVHFAPIDRKLRSAGPIPPVKLGPPLSWRPVGVAEAPADNEFDQAAEWQITVPPDALAHLNNIFLQVTYQGDIARISSNGKLLDDNFYNGTPWTLGLKRFLRAGPLETLDLSILPLRKDAPIYLQQQAWPTFPHTGQVDRLKSIAWVPEYQLVMQSTPAEPK